MWKNILKITLRNLYKDKFYAAVNIFGLAIGISCCLILGLYLYGELTYDRHHENHERIYRIARELTVDGATTPNDVTPLDMALLLQQDYPEIEEVTRFQNLSSTRYLFRHEDAGYYWENVRLAEDNVFEVFTHEVVYGDAATALEDPFSIAVSESFAQQYFGNENPIGELISSETADYRITLVYKDLPQNSHIRYDALLSMNRLPPTPESQRVNNLFNNSTYTYLLMPESMDQSRTGQILDDFYTRYMEDRAREYGTQVKFYAEPLKDVHYSSVAARGPQYGNWAYIFAMTSVAFFVLFVACINYMNLATARSTRRAKEVGMRKVMGAGKTQLVTQFIGESVMFTLAALCISLLAVYITTQFMPANLLMGKSIDLGLLWQPGSLLAITTMVVLVGVVSGMYPAFYLSTIQPIASVRGSKNSGASGVVVRKGLVFLQFIITIGVISSTLLMYRQMQFIENLSLGFEKENKLILNVVGADQIMRIPVFAAELERHPGVIEIASINGLPGQVNSSQTIPTQNNEGFRETQLFNRAWVGHNYLDVMNLELVTGRNFSDEIATDVMEAAIVNETAVRQLGWDNPIGKELGYDGQPTMQVIGVVKDFNFDDLRTEIQPILMTMDQRDFSRMDLLNQQVSATNLVINISGTGIRDTVEFIEHKWREFDPIHPFDFQFLDDTLAEMYQSEEQQMQLLGIFSGLCIFISGLGLFGVSAFNTSQRTREIGIRKVMGASSSQILILLFRSTMALVVTAALVASCLSYLLISRWLDEFQYSDQINLMAFVIATSAAIAIAFLTIALQSMKTVRANPIKALRYE